MEKLRVRLNKPERLFAWLDEHGYRYAVLWGYRHMDEQPGPERWKAMALLLEDRAAAILLRETPFSLFSILGTHCVVFSESGAHDAGFAGHAALPRALATSILANRTLWRDSFYVPCERDLYHALLYHIAYQQTEESLAHATDPAPFRNNPRYALLAELAERTGQPCDFSLFDMHRLLRENGYGIETERAIAYLQYHFKYRFKSNFYGLLFARENIGELNMFVLRSKVIRRGFRQILLDEIDKHYTVLAIKDIPWLTRFKKARYMRGNKWRRGGWPAIAVVVFYAAPIWRSAAERAKLHPPVFNERQFFKRELRERIVSEGGLYHKVNALHSTDNEAEAVGHLDLFFSPEEEQAIYAKAAEIRRKLAQGDTTGLAFNDF